jgi:hypothetical protein
MISRLEDRELCRLQDAICGEIRRRQALATPPAPLRIADDTERDPTPPSPLQKRVAVVRSGGLRRAA